MKNNWEKKLALLIFIVSFSATVSGHEMGATPTFVIDSQSGNCTISSINETVYSSNLTSFMSNNPNIESKCGNLGLDSSDAKVVVGVINRFNKEVRPYQDIYIIEQSQSKHMKLKAKVEAENRGGRCTCYFGNLSREQGWSIYSRSRGCDFDYNACKTSEASEGEWLSSSLIVAGAMALTGFLLFKWL